MARVRRWLGLIFVALAVYVALIIVLNPEQVMGVFVVILLLAIAQWLLTGTGDVSVGPDADHPPD